MGQELGEIGLLEGTGPGIPAFAQVDRSYCREAGGAERDWGELCEEVSNTVWVLEMSERPTRA